jgi:hypothetical protein
VRFDSDRAAAGAEILAQEGPWLASGRTPHGHAREVATAGLPLVQMVHNWKVQGALDVHVGKLQHTIIQPTQHDLTVGKLLRDVGAHKGQMKMAARKLNTFGEVSCQCRHLNSAPGLMRMKSYYDLASRLEAVATAKRRVK